MSRRSEARQADETLGDDLSIPHDNLRTLRPKEAQSSVRFDTSTETTRFRRDVSSDDSASTSQLHASGRPSALHRAEPPRISSDARASSRSGLEFRSIKTVHDSGAGYHAEWEQSAARTRMPITGLGEGSIPLPAANTTLLAEQSTGLISQDESAAAFARPANDTRQHTLVGSITKGSNVKSVSNYLCKAFKVSASDKSLYLPLDQLRDILSPSVVRQLLSEQFHEESASQLTQSVFGFNSSTGRRRIFAILVLIRKVKRIKDFVDRDIDDSSLPFTFVSSKDSTTKAVLSDTQQNTFQPPSLWSPKSQQDFLLYQRAVHVPFFDFSGENICFYELRSNTILPFDTYIPQTSGGYARVIKAIIHGAHHSHHLGFNGQQISFAIKRLHVPNDEEYIKEVEVFERLGLDKSRLMSHHLIPLQLTYRHGEDFYLIFPWADGNLKQFWEQEQFDCRDPEKVCWFFSQCWGITLGLRKIHHLHTRSETRIDASNASALVLSSTWGGKVWGRHGDIKPENILWFKEHDERRKNHLVISDFGLTRFNTAQTKSRVLQNQIEGFSGTHRPPDLHLDDEISPRYDIWSLGCVLLEFASWFLLGYADGIDAFIVARLNDESEISNQKEDKFFSLVDGNTRAVLKSSVLAWIKNLQTKCSRPLYELLDIIKTKMLEPNAQERSDSDLILRILGDLLQSCKSDSKYATNGYERAGS